MTLSQNFKAPLSNIDPFAEQMKFIVEQNADYFQSKGKNDLTKWELPIK